MAAGTPGRSDSEENVVSKLQADPEKGEGEEEDNEEEYEIEEVLDAKRGYFPEGRMGYWVSWKGYGPDENSWVDELDIGNALDLVDEFWRKNPLKQKGGRKSSDKKSPKKPRASKAAADASDVEETASKKRGRKSTSQKVESEDGMDVDEPTEKPPKKQRKSLTQGAKPKPSARTESPDEEKVIGSMKSYMHMKEWEGLVKSVDTVERVGNKLQVYFTLQTGESVTEASDICKERFPQKMIEFYESNLRWRSIEEES